MKARHAGQIRYALLSARTQFEPRRLTPAQQDFYQTRGHSKSWLLDGKLEHSAYDREARKAYLRIRRTK